MSPRMVCEPTPAESGDRPYQHLRNLYPKSATDRVVANRTVPSPAIFVFVPRFRPDISALKAYEPGRSLEEVSAEIGVPVDQIVKLASNETPFGPFPGVAEASAASLAESHRYPDNDFTALVARLSRHLGVARENLLFGNGSVALLSTITVACGGPGTSVVYAWPSFVMYRLAATWALMERIEVPLDAGHVHDLEAMASAIRHDTNLVFICNPNNPTGTIVDGRDLMDFIDAVPRSCLVVIDEAYHDFVTDHAYETALPLAVERDNVVVLRTFSKIYGLAGHRVGYAVGHPETLTALRKAQAPFTVSQVGQVAAAASLDDRAEWERRVEANAAARRDVESALSARGIRTSASQANFVYFPLDLPASEAARELMELGVIVRPMAGPWLRVTLGTDDENKTFLQALDRILTRR
jgi:histidinol-phosphate aminotransferase